MKETNLGFTITEDSIKKIKQISEGISNKTFHFHTHILYDIRTSLGEETKKYLEIGCYAGASSCLMASHTLKTNCFGIDLGEPISETIVLENVNKFKKPENNFQYFKGNSQNIEFVNEIKKQIGTVDILFIDGDHSEVGVNSDFVNFFDLVNVGGYIAFDDYLDDGCPQVKPAVDKICDRLDKSEYEIIGNLTYDFLNSFTHFTSNAIFIIKKIK